MSNRTAGPVRVGNVVRWIARVWSILSIAFFLLMFVGEAFMDSGTPLPTPIEWVGLALFPGGVVVRAVWSRA